MNKLLIAIFSVAALALPFVTSAQTGAPAEPAYQTAPAVSNTDSAATAPKASKKNKKKKHKKKKHKKAKH